MIPTAQLTGQWTEVHVETYSTPYPARYGCPAGIEHSTTVTRRRVHQGRVYDDVFVFVGSEPGHRHTVVAHHGGYVGVAADMIAQEQAAEQAESGSARPVLVTLPPRPRRPRKGEHKPVKTGRAARVRIGTYNSPARRQAVLAAVAERVNTGQLTAAGYLTEQLRTDADFTRRYSSPFGRAAAAVYRQQYGTDPAKTGLDVRGKRLVRVFAYGAEDTDVLEKAAADYARTAALLPVRPAAAAVEPTAERPAQVTPAALTAELAGRFPAPAEHVAERVEAIVTGMRANPRLYDQQRAALTPGGARVVRALVAAEQTEAQRQDARGLVAA